MKHYAFNVKTNRGPRRYFYRAKNFGSALNQARTKQEVDAVVSWEEVSEQEWERGVATSGQNSKACKGLHVTVNRRLR